MRMAVYVGRRRQVLLKLFFSPNFFHIAGSLLVALSYGHEMVSNLLFWFDIL